MIIITNICQNFKKKKIFAIRLSQSDTVFYLVSNRITRKRDFFFAMSLIRFGEKLRD